MFQEETDGRLQVAYPSTSGIVLTKSDEGCCQCLSHLPMSPRKKRFAAGQVSTVSRDCLDRCEVRRLCALCATFANCTSRRSHTSVLQ